MTPPDGAPCAKPVSKPAEPPKPVQLGGESFLDRILPHMKKIIVGIIVLAAILIVIFPVRWFRAPRSTSVHRRSICSRRLGYN